MPTSDKLIEKTLSTIDDAVTSFNSSVPATQKKAFAKVVELLNDLDKSNGKVKVTVKNVRLIQRIKKELESIIISNEYKKKVELFVVSFDEVTDLNNQYFSKIATEFEPSTIFQEIKTQSIDAVRENLLTTGMRANIVNKLGDILNQNITTGARMEDLTEQVRIFLTDTKEGDGALVRYAKVYTIDALNQYNAQYTATATDDLGLEWYKYVGSLITTSRPFCNALIDAKKNGMEYIHRSQFKDLLKGNVNGKRVPLYDKTELPEGMIAGTNEFNFPINRGGYGCGHQLMPVSSAVVPKELRDKFANK